MANRNPSHAELVLDFEDEGSHTSERQSKKTLPPPFEMESFARDMDSPTSAVRSIGDVSASESVANSRDSQVSKVRRAPASTPLEDMRASLAGHDFSNALVLAESVLDFDPTNLEAKACLARCQGALQDKYLERIGSLDQVPTLAVSHTELRKASLDNRAGFVVSLVDGVSSLEMILDVTSMPPLESLRLVLELVQQGIITLS